MSFSIYQPFFQAMVLLMKPLVEIVVHDLESGVICCVEGTLSNRKVGDPSLLDPGELEANLDSIVYPKLNFDGRLVKSISVPLEGRWLVCINWDVSVFSQMQSLGQEMLQRGTQPKPESLFKNDWQERLHLSVHAYLKDKAWSLDAMTGKQKKEVVRHLFDMGAFNEKNAATYIATILSMGRATIFNYLKEWR